MRRPHVAALVAALLVALVVGPALGGLPGSAASAAPEEPTTVVVTMREQADLGDITGATRRARLRDVIETLQATADQGQATLSTKLDTWADQGSVVDYDPLWVVDAISVTATPQVIAAIAARPDVATVTPDAVALVPATMSAERNQVEVRAPDVWDQGDTGGGVVVATLDSGADVTHPDLESRWRGGTNSWYDPYGEHPTAPVDLSGHGTATLGAMVGGDAGGTSIGTAPGARWIAARVFDDRGGSTSTAVHQAFQWLLDPDGNPTTADAPHVVNGSWSIGAGPGCDLTFQPDVQALSAAGILPVFAAGNFGSGTGSGVSPANYPESLAVGALSTTGSVLASSSRGPADCGGRTGVFPDLVAPGEDIMTTDRYGLYQVVSGTSIAAPHAAGALALMLSARPALTAEQQRIVLQSTAMDLGPPGPDDDYGAGRLDTLAAYQSGSAPAPDFALAATPAAVSVPAGGTASYDVAVTAANGFAADVSLAVSGPAGVTGSLAPAVVAGGSGSSRLTVTTSALTAPGSYQVTVTGTSGALSHAATVTLTVQAAPPPAGRLEFSTLGSANPPGLTGSPDPADVLSWDGQAFRRVVDASAAPYLLPAGANIDGFSRRDASRFYASFSTDTRIPGLGTVQDEDVVYFDGARWAVWFDGTNRRLTAPELDLDAISVVGSVLYFSTAGPMNPSGVQGIADDADVYSWDGRAFARVWDGTAHGLGSAANVDGLDVTDPTHFWLSFSSSTTQVVGLGKVQDEDVVRYGAGSWSIYFDGSAYGLTTDALDIDAFDVS